jgi:Fe-S oxidoreductase
MFKEVWPLLKKGDDKVQMVSDRVFNPFEYLMARHSDGFLDTNFINSLGKVSLHIPCHVRAQNMGMKTRDFLSLIPKTEVLTIERCSGHNGTYSFKKESHITSMKICKPVAKKVKDLNSDCYSSDCPMAAKQIENSLSDGSCFVHPFTLAKKAYGI